MTETYPRLEVRPREGGFGVYVVFSNGAAVLIGSATTWVAAKRIADHYAKEGAR